MPAHDLETLRAFRTALHGCFRRRADALFELVDALLAAETVASLPHLSLQAAHRRGWGSLYDALAEGALDVAALQRLLTRHAADDGPAVYAVDLSVWPRCDAEASPERGFYYHPSRHSAGQPIVAGWAYQWLAQLSFTRDSWTTPLDVRRVHPRQNANAVAVEQITDLLSRLPSGGSTAAVRLRCWLRLRPIDARSGRTPRRGPGPPPRRPLLLRRPAASSAVAQGGSPAQARGEVRLQGSGDLACAER